MQEIYTIGRYFKSKFKTKVYKVPISITGFTCPNIDGKVAKGGCSFCENYSFSPNLKKDKNRFYLNLESKENPLLESQVKELKEQFYKSIKDLKAKNGAKKFIVYFQSFTNTYAPLSTLKRLYSEALALDDVVGLSIGTRTDSITIETLEYLQDLAKDKEIWVEYGVQSTNSTTLERINRGHDVDSMIDMIKLTKEKYNLNICAHLIFGLPNDTESDMLKSTQDVVDLGVDSIKIHPLYVVKNTILTNEYLSCKFTPISQDDYIDILVKALKVIPPNISIQRVTAGINDDSLLAPKWCSYSKNSQMRPIKKALIKAGLNY
jgi:radical SAM protein (TIGR01212 family)